MFVFQIYISNYNRRIYQTLVNTYKSYLLWIGLKFCMGDLCGSLLYVVICLGVLYGNFIKCWWYVLVFCVGVLFCLDTLYVHSMWLFCGEFLFQCFIGFVYSVFGFNLGFIWIFCVGILFRVWLRATKLPKV